MHVRCTAAKGAKPYMQVQTKVSYLMVCDCLIRVLWHLRLRKSQVQCRKWWTNHIVVPVWSRYGEEKRSKLSSNDRRRTNGKVNRQHSSVIRFSWRSSITSIVPCIQISENPNIECKREFYQSKDPFVASSRLSGQGKRRDGFNMCDDRSWPPFMEAKAKSWLCQGWYGPKGWWVQTVAEIDREALHAI